MGPVVSVVFAPGNKWRFTDGLTIFWAALKDEEFVRRVNEGVEAFRRGDMLRCRVRLVQTRRPERLHTDYVVVQVLQRLPRPEQLSLGESTE